MVYGMGSERSISKALSSLNVVVKELTRSVESGNPCASMFSLVCFV